MQLITAYQLMCAGRLNEALAFAQAAVRGAKVCMPAHGMLAAILRGLGETEQAERTVIAALQLGAGSADAYDALAHVSISLQQPERANALYRCAVTQEPLTSRFWYNLASSERSLGRIAEAEAACDHAIGLDRSAYPSYLLRSELRVQTTDSNHIPELESALSGRDLDDGGRVALGYALAKELDDIGRYDEAFHWYSASAASRRARLSYDVSVDERKIQRIKEVYFRENLSSRGARSQSARYIFILGLPRSGTTLLERILTSLKGVRTNGETDNFSRALLRATQPGPDDVFARAARADPGEVAREYAKLAGAAADDSQIIEKLPLNYLYLGAICRALPKAKLIWMRRAPLESCFAMYRTLFGEAYPFSYGFEDLARYYVAYDGLMNYWRSALGAQLYEVRYEELVRHPEAVSANVVAYCGLEWRPSAIQVENNDRASFTASASQVRRPIYTTSVDRSQHYSRHLEPLAQRLRELGAT